MLAFQCRACELLVIELPTLVFNSRCLYKKHVAHMESHMASLHVAKEHWGKKSLIPTLFLLRQLSSLVCERRKQHCQQKNQTSLQIANTFHYHLLQSD